MQRFSKKRHNEKFENIATPEFVVIDGLDSDILDDDEGGAKDVFVFKTFRDRDAKPFNLIKIKPTGEFFSLLGEWAGIHRLRCYPDAGKKITNQEDIEIVFDGRVWVDRCSNSVELVAFWNKLDDDELLKKYLSLCIDNLTNDYQLKFESCRIAYEEENQVVVYDILQSFLDSENNKLRDTAAEKMLHVLTPIQKWVELKKNHKLMKKRQDYLNEGDKAFRAKHNGMDPLEYHLLAYEE